MKRAFRFACVGAEPCFEREICAQRDMTVPIAKLCFWGVRGSTPTVDPATWRYGGNTPCLELIAPDSTKIILDCGTGLRMLGSRWAASNGGKAPGTHILVTHYHWDHIQGIPFFSPLYVENNEFNFYSFRSKFLTRQPETSLRSADGSALFPRGNVGDECQAEVQGSGRRRFFYGW